MRIGELADTAGVPTRTIRFYERRGLLPEPRRAPNGYREYADETVARMRFIRTSQAAGLTLAEIRSIVEIRDDGGAPCAHVGALLESKLNDVRDRQRRLAALESELLALIDRSNNLDPADCGQREVCHIIQAPASGRSRQLSA